MDNRFRHNVCNRSSHQFIEMRHNLTGREGKRLKEIEFGDDAQHLPCFYDGKGIEIMSFKQCFQVAQGDLARNGSARRASSDPPYIRESDTSLPLNYCSSEYTCRLP